MIISNELMKDYLANPSIGSSSAKRCLDSIRLFKDARDGLVKSQETDATAFGTAFHARILQPDLFMSLLSEGPINEKTGKPYGRDTNKWAEWEAVNPGRIVLSPDEMETLLLMQERMPPEVRAIFARADAQREISIYQTALGLPLKCRPDQLDDYITDLKTIDDIANIRRAFRQRKYWFSEAWYKHIVALETGRVLPHRFVFAEKKAPWRWRIVIEDPDRLEQSAMRVRGVLSMIADAALSNQWDDQDSVYKNITWDDCGVYEDDEITQTPEGISL